MYSTRTRSTRATNVLLAGKTIVVADDWRSCLEGADIMVEASRLDSRADAKPTWWEACGQTGPFGSRYGWWWRHQFFLTAFYHAIAISSTWLAVWF